MNVVELVDKLLVEITTQWTAYYSGDATGETPPKVCDFLRQYPQLLEDNDAVLDLLQQEMEIRSQAVSMVTLIDEYRELYPEQWPELSALFIDDLEETLSARSATTINGLSWSGGLANGPPTLTRMVLGQYLLEREIGGGGCGVVYEATHLVTNGKYAIKLLRPDYPPQGTAEREKALQRFYLEAEAQEKLKDLDDFVRIHEVGKFNGEPYIVMELVADSSLQRWLEDGLLPTFAERLSVVAAVASAMQSAHERGLVHRDLKPTNVLLTRDKKIKIADLGMVWFLEEPHSLTSTNQIVGTYGYLAPEQVNAKAFGDPSPATDVFALGAMLYALLTGRPPFLGPSAPDCIRLLDDPYFDAVPLTDCVSSAHASHEGIHLIHLDKVCRHALEKRPTDRYQSAKQFSEDVLSIVAGESPKWAKPQPLLRRIEKAYRQNPRRTITWVALPLLSLLALATVIAWVSYSYGRRQAQENTTIRQQTSSKLELLYRKAKDLHGESKTGGSEVEDLKTSITKLVKVKDLLEEGIKFETASGLEPEARFRKLLATVTQEQEEASKALKLLTRWDEISLRSVVSDAEGLTWEDASQERAMALRKIYGLERKDLQSPEKVKQRLNGARRVWRRLAGHFDECALLCTKYEDKTQVRQLLILADQFDPEPERSTVRKLVADQKIAQLLAHVKLMNVHTSQPGTIVLAAEALLVSGKHEAMAQLLDRAVQEHPNHFWIRFYAGLACSLSIPPRHEDAIIHYSAAEALQPQAAEVRVNLISVLLKRKGREDLMRAERHGIRAITLDPSFGIAWQALGMVQLVQKDYQRALESFRKAAHLEPTYAKAHHQIGFVIVDSQRVGDLEEAIRRLRRAKVLREQQRGKLRELIATKASVEQEQKKTIRTLGRALLRRGGIKDVKEAETLLGKAEHQYQLGLKLFNDGDAMQIDKVIDHFEDAKELWLPDPSKHARSRLTVAYVHLGVALAKRNNPEDFARIVNCYESALKIDPRLAEAHYNLGNAYSARKQLDLAVGAYREAIACDPWLVNAHANLARALMARAHVGDLPRAIHEMQEALRFWQKNPEAQVDQAAALADIGTMLRMQGGKENLARSVEVLKQSLQLLEAVKGHTEVHAITYSSYAETLYQRNSVGDHDKALEYFRRSLELIPGRTVWAERLAELILSKSKGENRELLQEAVAHYQRLLGKPSTTIAVPLNLAYALRRLGNRDEAVRILRIAQKQAPQHYLVQNNLGYALLKRGKPQDLDEAIFRFLKCILLNPKYQRAYHNLHNALKARKPTSVQERFPTHFPDMACGAVLLGLGKITLPEPLTNAERAKWRTYGLTWLHAELAYARKQALLVQQQHPVSSQELLRRLLQHEELSVVRSPKELQAFPDDERQKWNQFWTEVRQEVKGAGN